MHRLLPSAFTGLKSWLRPAFTSAPAIPMFQSWREQPTSHDTLLVGCFGQVSLRHFRNRQVGPTIREMNRRRERIRLDQKIRHGKETISKRSEFLEWNYTAELSAFSARIGESFDDAKLREAFLSPSYVVSELRRRESLGLEVAMAPMATNERLAKTGLRLAEDVLTRYTRAAFPYLPEEGVVAFVQYLTSLDVLANTSFHIGTRDLIMSEEYPPLRETYRRTFLALVGALAESSVGRAERLVVDLLAAQLHSEDINELWEIPDPMKTLAKVLENGSRGEPEARLLWVNGKDTMLSCYQVGVYCDKELIGQAPGETAEIAEEMAARDALRRLFRTDDARAPLLLGDDLDRLVLKSDPNLALNQWSEKKAAAGNLVRLEESS